MVQLSKSLQRTALLLAAGAGSLLLATSLPAADPNDTTIKADGGKLRVEIGGQLFTEYNYQDVPRPFFYPVLGPGQAPMTRNWPMKQAENEDHDHPHQKSLWFTHGSVNGIDFWADGPDKGRIVHEKFIKILSGVPQGIVHTQDKWMAPDGKIVCTDDRIMRFSSQTDCRILDFEITVHASHGAVTFGDTKEGSLGMRLAATLRLRGKVGQGHIVNSAGQRDNDTWGKRADWCDYYGPVNGQTVGVAIFDHPGNPRHPTWWHVRDYGLFAANPFGEHDFEGKPAGTGNLTIPAGHDLTFRYRLLFHKGDEQQSKVAERYLEYVAPAGAK
ncbi:MAG: PmoA family protein [Candidatus Omnitrophica bacterium]|nr:PmoA family protein [Candidatus Omnitrophota bacterium]